MKQRFSRFKKRWAQRLQKFPRPQFAVMHRHPVLLSVVVFISLAALTAGGFLLFSHGQPKFRPISSYIVILSHDHQQQTVPTNEPTVGALLSKLGITIAKGDVVEPGLQTAIKQDNFRVNIYRAMPVQIRDGTDVTYTLSAATTPRSIAQKAGVTVYPEDTIQLAHVDNFIGHESLGKEVVIDRATPVNLNVYGTPTLVRTHAKTVAELLKQKDITLEDGDTLQPGPSTPITPNLQVYLIRKGTQIVTTSRTVPMPVQTVRDNSLTFGTSAVRQQGSDGQEVLTYQVNLVNGQEVGRTLIQTVVTVPPVPKIIARGQAVSIPGDKQAVMAQAGISSSDYKYVDYIMSHESGWCPTKLQGQIGYCPGYAPATMPAHLGYGLGQATPGTKMSGFGGDWKTNPVTQLRWATSYALGRYGSWEAAYNFWYRHHYW